MLVLKGFTNRVHDLDHISKPVIAFRDIHFEAMCFAAGVIVLLKEPGRKLTLADATQYSFSRCDVLLTEGRVGDSSLVFWQSKAGDGPMSVLLQC